jgi:hypothetical protein
MCNQRCREITHEVLRIEAALRSHQIETVKIRCLPNNSEHELFCADLLPRSFWCLFEMDIPFRGVLILKGEPPFVTRDNDGEFARLYAL